MSDQESEDLRIDHIKVSAQQVLNFDLSHWKELIWKEENQAIIKDFLDTPTTTVLLVYFDITNKLTLSLEVLIQPPMPERCCYFLKISLTVSMELYKFEIIFGKLCDISMSQYEDMFVKVIAPIICNPLNNPRWPSKNALDIANHFQDFKTTLSYLVGLAEEKTVLMIPETAKHIDNFNVEEISERDSFDWELRNILNSITEMLSNWIPVVKEVLEVTTEHILSQVNQGPTTEILFWNKRKTNLEFIYAQVISPLVKKMVLALEKTKNCHFPNFKVLLQDVSEGLDEAREICENFKNMSEELQQLNVCSFPKLIYLLPEAMKEITHSLIHSKYYKSIPSRIIVLLQKMCYLLIEKTHKFLDPPVLFKGNRDEAKRKVKLSVDIVNSFLKSYNDCRDELRPPNKETKLYPWEFPDERVFTEFRKFTQRLDEIQEIFLAADIYFHISTQKLISVPQLPYRKRLEKLQSKFAEMYKSFENCTYDPLDITCTDFRQDYDTFSKQLQELDVKLGILVGQLCSTCNQAEDALKVMVIFQDLVKRPSAQHELKKVLISSHIVNICVEFLNSKQYCNRMMTSLDKFDKISVYKNLPMISGALQWSLDLQRKLAPLVVSLLKEKENLKDSVNFKCALKLYQEMEDLLNEFEQFVLSKWKTTLDAFSEKLDQEVFFTDDAHCVSLNFDSQISEVAQEIRYLKQIEKNIFLLEVSLKFDEISESVILSQSLLACSVRWYNDLAKNLVEYEKRLLSRDWNEIISLVIQGHAVKWTSSGLLTYAEKIYTVTKSVYESVNQAKGNVAEVKEFIKSWSYIPIFTREKPGSLVDFTNCVTSKLCEQLKAVKKTSELMENVLERNRELFKSDISSDEWRSYMSYLESIIEDGLKDVVKYSLLYLIRNTDPGNKKLAPFYKVDMILEKDVRFEPPLKLDDPKSLHRLFEAVVEEIYSVAGAIKRMTDTDSDYSDAICECPKLGSLKASINQNVMSGRKKALAESEIFQRYSDLWLKNIEDVLTDFVIHGPDQDSLINDKDEFSEVQIESKMPTEEEFKNQIAQFDQLLRKIKDIPSVFEVESWMLLNVGSFKDSLLSIIRNWSSAYKRKLVELKSLGKLRILEEDGEM